MDKLIPYLYKSYGEAINSGRSFCSINDGLKPIERRCLYSLYEIARSKFVKSARVVGHVMGHYSPHGSSYGTLNQLVRNCFAIGQGNWGSYVGIEHEEPAAERYTEIRLNKLIDELSFKFIDYVPFIQEDLDPEPKYIPTLFPFCLIGKIYTIGIGFGYRTYIPCYEIKDLFKRLKFLLGIIKEEPIIKPITDCDILSSEKELKDLLTKSKVSIKVKGKYEVNNNSKVLTLKSWPDSISFDKITKKLNKELENGDIEFDDYSNESGTKVEFRVKKQRNKDEIFENMKNKIDLSIIGNLNFEINITNENEKVKPSTIDKMLLYSYNLYIKTFIDMLNVEKEKIQNQKNEYLNLLKIKPFLTDNLNKNINNINEFELSVKNISVDSEVEESIVKNILSKYRIDKLLRLNLDINQLDESIDKIDNILVNPNEYILKQYEEKFGG